MDHVFVYVHAQGLKFQVIFPLYGIIKGSTFNSHDVLSSGLVSRTTAGERESCWYPAGSASWWANGPDPGATAYSPGSSEIPSPATIPGRFQKETKMGVTTRLLESPF